MGLVKPSPPTLFLEVLGKLLSDSSEESKSHKERERKVCLRQETAFVGQHPYYTTLSLRHNIDAF